MIDLTFVNLEGARTMFELEAAEEETLSDHRLMEFQLFVGKNGCQKVKQEKFLFLSQQIERFRDGVGPDCGRRSLLLQRNW